MLVKISKDFSEEVTPEEVKVVVDLVQQLGPSVSAVEMQRMAKQSNVDLSVEDIETVIQIQEEMGGKKLTDAEIQVKIIKFVHFYFS
jgi:Holliday junction resolvase